MHDKRTRVRRLATLIIVIIGFTSLNKLLFSPRQQIISPIPDTPVVVEKAVAQAPKRSFNIFAKKKDPDELSEKINAVIDGAWNDYSIVVEDYTSNFALRTSEGQIYVAASVNKVPILAALYYYADKGDIDLDRNITIQSADIQDYGTGSIRYNKPGTVYSVKTLAKLMIKQSDNTAAYILANHIIGFPKLKEIVATWGMTQTDMVANKTSNQDIAKLFRMIYEGKVASPALTQEMLSFLKDTDFETRLPSQLPDSATSYHKIGTEVGIVHDAGVFTDGKHTYYLGVFTNGTAEGEEIDKLFGKLSKTVFDYLTK